MTYVILLAVLLLALIPGVYAGVWFRRHDRPVFRSLGFAVSRRTLVEVGLGLAAAFVAIAFVFTMVATIGGVELLPRGVDGRILLIVTFDLLVSALFEEVVFRVLLLCGLMVLFRRLAHGRWFALAGMALVFGAVHLMNENSSTVGAAGTMCLGLLLGVAFLVTRAIWLPLALHVSWNLSLALWGFPVSGGEFGPGWFRVTSTGPEILNGGKYGPEGSIFGMLAAVALIVVVFAYGRRVWPNGSVARLTFAPDPVKRPRR